MPIYVAVGPTMLIWFCHILTECGEILHTTDTKASDGIKGLRTLQKYNYIFSRWHLEFMHPWFANLKSFGRVFSSSYINNVNNNFVMHGCGDYGSLKLKIYFPELIAQFKLQQYQPQP